MSTPKVSIIVPTYNVEKYAAKCFESLLNQTIKDIEIILVDDGSTDSSGDICDEYAAKDKRIKVIHQQNIGLGLSRNSGMEIATGEYIGFVDSDDYVSKNMYRILYENAKLYNADISYCKYKRVNGDIKNIDNDKRISSIIKVWGKNETLQYLLDMIGLPPKCKKDTLYSVSVWCGIFSREYLKNINASFVSEREFLSEDIIFDIDVIPNCRKIVRTDTDLYYYRNNNNSLSRSYKKDRFEKVIELYNEMYKRLSNVMDYSQFKNSLYRFLISYTRGSITQEVKYSRKNGYRKALDNIRKICSNKELDKVLDEYDYLKLPFKYALLCFFEKYKLILPCFAACYLYQKFINHAIY